MKSGKLYMLGLTGLLTLGLMTTGCSDETSNVMGGSDQIQSPASAPTTEQSSTDAPFNRTADASGTFDFNYEMKFRTSIKAIDRKGGTLVVDYDPKFVKLDPATVYFARADVSSKYDTGQGGSSLTGNIKELKLSMDDLVEGDEVVVYANIVDGHDLYAVAVEVVVANSGLKPLAE